MSAKLLDYTTVDTTRAYVLGEERTEYDSTYGWRTYRYIKNDDAAAATAIGNLILTDAGAEYFYGKLSDAGGIDIARALGVAISVLAIDEFGWLVRKGRVICLGDGAVAAGESLASHTGGDFDTWAAGEGSLGVAETDDDAVTLLFTGVIDV